MKSLYSEPWPEASQYGSVDNRNGYPHSMRAAGIRFAEGCYPNELACTLPERGTIRFGLKCDIYRGDCWCCFDNFELLYQGLPDFYDSLPELKASEVQNDISSPDAHSYDLSGRETSIESSQPGLYIVGGKKVLKK